MRISKCGCGIGHRHTSARRMSALNDFFSIFTSCTEVKAAAKCQEGSRDSWLYFALAAAVTHRSLRYDAYNYRKSENFRVQKISCKKFSSKKISGCERLSEIKNTANFWTGNFRVFNFRIFGGVRKYPYTENFRIYGIDPLLCGAPSPTNGFHMLWRPRMNDNLHNSSTFTTPVLGSKLSFDGRPVHAVTPLTNPCTNRKLSTGKFLPS